MATRLRYYVKAEPGEWFAPFQFVGAVGLDITVMVGDDSYQVTLRSAHVDPSGYGVDVSFHQGNIDALVAAIGQHPGHPVRILWPNPERVAAEPPVIGWRGYAVVGAVALGMLGGLALLANLWPS